jgi:Zn-dependent metalloprotease
MRTCGFALNKTDQHVKKEVHTIKLYSCQLNTFYNGTHTVYLERISNDLSPRQNSTFIGEVDLQSFNNGCTIRVLDIQESNLDINEIYSNSFLKKLPVVKVDPNEQSYANDCLVYAYEYINFLKDYNIKFPFQDLFILMNAPDMENAYWNGYFLVFGNGIEYKSKAFVSAAIIGHEMTHALIQSSINLDYYHQSGALNESYSDIFGVMFEFYFLEKHKGIGFELGSELFYNNNALRSFVEPNKYNQPSSIRDRLYYHGKEDCCGVHINSGVPNHLFYRMTLITSKKEVFNIFLKVFFKLSHNSNFNEFKRILLSYCIDNIEYVNIINEIL